MSDNDTAEGPATVTPEPPDCRCFFPCLKAPDAEDGDWICDNCGGKR